MSLVLILYYGESLWIKIKLVLDFGHEVDELMVDGLDVFVVEL